MTTETMKWIKLLQGLISVVQCFGGELPFFYLAGMIMLTVFSWMLSMHTKYFYLFLENSAPI